MALAARKSLLIKQRLGLQTRCANEIANEFNPTIPEPRDHEICKKWRTEYPKAKPRTDAPTFNYNCHGLTFAARRTQIWSSEEVDFILREDGYEELPLNSASPGDVIVYFSTETGEIEHSGIIIEAARRDNFLGPRVVSKWGPCQEFIHFYTDCPYTPATVKCYRIPK